MKQKVAHWLNSLLWRNGARLTRIAETEAFLAVFYRFYHKEFFFVQIGANDGVRADPIHRLVIRHRLHGLAVEPLPDMFNALQQTYRNYPEVSLANVAVHRTDREVVLHRVRSDAQVDDWAHGIASINPRHHELSGTQATMITTERVPAISLEGLLDAYSVTRCDAFLVDTEGYDSEIISMLLDTSLRPSIVLFEHGLLQGVMDLDKYKDLAARLIDEGYFLIMEEGDAIAYKPI
jgi:FkbM family methyltransferase